MTNEAIQVRETLEQDALALARRGLVDRRQLAGLRGINGYKNIANDLQLLIKLQQDAWPKIRTKVASTRPAN